LVLRFSWSFDAAIMERPAQKPLHNLAKSLIPLPRNRVMQQLLVRELESPAIQLDLEAGHPMIRAVKHRACSYLSPLAAMFVAATQSEAAFKAAASRRHGRVTQVSL